MAIGLRENKEGRRHNAIAAPSNSPIAYSETTQQTTGGEQSGFGLGLPIGAAIAAEHKGTLKAESDAASTRFIFTMPLKR